MDHDVTEAEDLLPDLHRCAVALARKGWYDEATLVDTTATRMRIMQDDLEDLAAQLAEKTEAFRVLEAQRKAELELIKGLRAKIRGVMSAPKEGDRDRWGGRA